MKKLLFLCIGFLFLHDLYGQGYNISVKIDGLYGVDDLLLANHFGDKQYLRDTSETDKQGIYHFRGEKRLESGIYLVVLPDHSHFEIVISKQGRPDPILL